MSSRFTVLLCIHREPALLPFAIETVLWQSHENFELFIVCDGAPAETVCCAREFAGRDPRIRVFEFAKGERNGERHRDAVLALASGEFVAHIAYDDLWFPDHLRELAALLGEVEFGNLVLMGMGPDGAPVYFPGDLSDPDMRARLLVERWNFFGPTVVGYRLATYRRLPEGWAPAPPDVWSDLHMWRKFLRLDGITVDTRFTIQSLCLHNEHRGPVTLQQRRAETERWIRVIRDPAQRAALVDRYWGGFAKRHVPLHSRLTRTERELAALHEKAAGFEGRLLERERAYVTLHDKAAGFETRLDERERELGALHVKAAGFEADLRARERNLVALHDRALGFEARLVERERELAALHARAANAEARLAQRDGAGT